MPLDPSARPSKHQSRGWSTVRRSRPRPTPLYAVLVRTNIADWFDDRVEIERPEGWTFEGPSAPTDKARVRTVACVD
jgi:hypothetical protein